MFHTHCKCYTHSWKIIMKLTLVSGKARSLMISCYHKNQSLGRFFRIMNSMLKSPDPELEKRPKTD